MTREDVLKLFPDATDEQITNLLNQNNSEVAREKGKADKYKADAQKADDLQKQLDDLNSQNLSDIEKANKALETANQRIAELEKAQEIATQRSSVAEKFKVTSDNFQIMKSNTLKFNLENNISIIKFNGTENDINNFTTDGWKEIEAYCECAINEWNGKQYPQLILCDYNIIKSSKFFF